MVYITPYHGMITGYFNVPVDKTSDGEGRTVPSILDSHRLTQHLNRAT